jgi:hypothetical protein
VSNLYNSVPSASASFLDRRFSGSGHWPSGRWYAAGQESVGIFMAYEISMSRSRMFVMEVVGTTGAKVRFQAGFLQDK